MSADRILPVSCKQRPPMEISATGGCMKEISYWNNRRICSANGGLPPIVKRQQYYDSLKEAA